jgi:hypothetical protein
LTWISANSNWSTSDGLVNGIPGLLARIDPAPLNRHDPSPLDPANVNSRLTDEKIDDASIQIKTKFEARDNATGLQMLGDLEEGWDASGQLSDK